MNSSASAGAAVSDISAAVTSVFSRRMGLPNLHDLLQGCEDGFADLWGVYGQEPVNGTLAGVVRVFDPARLVAAKELAVTFDGSACFGVEALNYLALPAFFGESVRDDALGLHPLVVRLFQKHRRGGHEDTRNVIGDLGDRIAGVFQGQFRVVDPAVGRVA